jgi:hypothetical protein
MLSDPHSIRPIDAPVDSQVESHGDAHKTAEDSLWQAATLVRIVLRQLPSGTLTLTADQSDRMRLDRQELVL